jgi:hypothetical protein
MDKSVSYSCKDCKTNRYLVFPNGDESFIICSACYRIRNEGDAPIKEPPTTQKPLYRIFH